MKVSITIFFKHFRSFTITIAKKNNINAIKVLYKHIALSIFFFLLLIVVVLLIWFVAEDPDMVEMVLLGQPCCMESLRSPNLSIRRRS